MPKPTTTTDPKIEPNPSLEKRVRRLSSVEYKLSILQQADACKHGELGQLLRREKLYSNQLSQWRRELAEQGVERLKKSVPGPAPKKTVEQKRIEQLEKENERLRKQVEMKDGCLLLQKKSFGSAGRDRGQRIMNLLVQEALPKGVSERNACDALDLCRNSLRAARARYHFCGPVSPYRRKRSDTTQPRALNAEERDQIKEVLTRPEYHDQPPAQVYSIFLRFLALNLTRCWSKAPIYALSAPCIG